MKLIPFILLSVSLLFAANQEALDEATLKNVASGVLAKNSSLLENGFYIVEAKKMDNIGAIQIAVAKEGEHDVTIMYALDNDTIFFGAVLKNGEVLTDKEKVRVLQTLVTDPFKNKSQNSNKYLLDNFVLVGQKPKKENPNLFMIFSFSCPHCRAVVENGAIAKLSQKYNLYVAPIVLEGEPSEVNKISSLKKQKNITLDSFVSMFGDVSTAVIPSPEAFQEAKDQTTKIVETFNMEGVPFFFTEKSIVHNMTLQKVLESSE